VKKNESFRDYFRRARHDEGVRAQFLRTARIARSFFGWLAVLFIVLGVCQVVYDMLHSGTWLSRTLIVDAACHFASLLVHEKFGDRIAALETTDGSP
jgi:hypothetical protein